MRRFSISAPALLLGVLCSLPAWGQVTDDPAPTSEPPQEKSVALPGPVAIPEPALAPLKEKVAIEGESPPPPGPAVKEDDSRLSVRERALRRSKTHDFASPINRLDVILPILGGLAGGVGTGVLFGSAMQDRALLDAGAAWSRTEAEVIATRGMQKQVLAYAAGAVSLGALAFGGYRLYQGLTQAPKPAPLVVLPMLDGTGLALLVSLP